MNKINVIIECRPKSAMQSGRANMKSWRIIAPPATRRDPDPTMGWISANDTMSSLKSIVFPDVDSAISFARQQGWSYRVREPEVRQVTPRSYLDRFKKK